MSQPPCCHRRDKESAVYRPHSALRNLRCPKGGSVSLPHHAFKGVALNYPLLLWDGVALSYPTDATMEPLSIRWTPGAADRLAGVRISDAGGSASSCPHFGQLPAGVIVLQNAAPPLLSRSIRAQMYGFFIFQHRQRLRNFRFSHRCDRLRILPTISAIWPVAQMVSIFPRIIVSLNSAPHALCGPWLALWRVLLFGGIFFPLGGASAGWLARWMATRCLHIDSQYHR